MSQSDHPDGPGTLPPPELNPLLNPLLAENMGRWAQVYFTSPPEKREQAVQELVRVLEAEKSGANASSVAPAPVPQRRAEAVPPSPAQRPEIQPAFLECRSCGKKNPAPQRFCGMCGSRLGEPDAAADEALEALEGETIRRDAIADFPSREERGAADYQENSHQNVQEADRQQQGMWQRQEQRQVWGEDLQGEELRREALQRESDAQDRNDDRNDDPNEDRNHDRNDDRNLETHAQPEPAPSLRSQELQYFLPRRDDYAPRGRTNELSLFQAGPEDYDTDTDVNPRPARMYVAIALVIVVSILAYLAWRNAHETSRNSKPPDSYATTEEPVSPDSVAANAPAANAPKNDTPPTTPATGNPANSSPNAAEETRSNAAPANPVLKKPSSNPAEAEVPATPQPARNSAEPLTGPGAGAEELAVAEGYLNGTNGQGRNTTEASKWLWKAIAKHNADATFLLSELYLRGDGVPKNCDQAHVLLDAATLKGVKGAGERLRHLQAFGCQ